MFLKISIAFAGSPPFSQALISAFRAQDLAEELHRPGGLPALLARADQGAIGDDVGPDASRPHRGEQLQELIVLAALLAGADERVEGDYVGLQALLLHGAEQLQRPVRLAALLAG